ncbi:MAG: hypothetical protein EOO06_07635 [Chitinophagaceae bacterium]|nr:MAG: hypothetical protein EOO06_07635 [Chitinophagaceae bacterium]
MNSKYSEVIVESFIPQNTSGQHGLIHIRPIPGQDPFLPDMMVECSKDLSYKYEIGTKFRIKAKITSKEDGKPFIYSYYRWTYTVL